MIHLLQTKTADREFLQAVFLIFLGGGGGGGPGDRLGRVHDGFMMLLFYKH